MKGELEGVAGENSGEDDNVEAWVGEGDDRDDAVVIK